MNEIHFTRDTKLASCLCTLGIPLRSEDPIMDVRKGNERIINYFFESKSKDGSRTFANVVRDWNNQDLHVTDPENPVNYIKSVLFNRERLLDLMNKATPLGMIERGDKCLLIPLKASDNLKNAMFKKL